MHRKRGLTRTERIDFRVSTEEKERLFDAAAAVRKTVTLFIMDLVTPEVDAVLAEISGDDDAADE